jgi:maltose O-acetyltransferase
VAGSYLTPRPLRWVLYRVFGLKVHTMNVKSHCFVGGPKIEIGRGSFVHYGCFFEAADWIRIGTDCDIAMNVTFCTSTHSIGPAGRRAGAWQKGPIAIGNGCWIGAGATVLPGVSIGVGCIIAAGSLVARDCVANGLYAGVPARLIRDLSTP